MMVKIPNRHATNITGAVMANGMVNALLGFPTAKVAKTTLYTQRVLVRSDKPPCSLGH